jgi:hypothetical protein
VQQRTGRAGTGATARRAREGAWCEWGWCRENIDPGRPKRRVREGGKGWEKAAEGKGIRDWGGDSPGGDPPGPHAIQRCLTMVYTGAVSPHRGCIASSSSSPRRRWGHFVSQRSCGSPFCCPCLLACQASKAVSQAGRGEAGECEEAGEGRWEGGGPRGGEGVPVDMEIHEGAA